MTRLQELLDANAVERRDYPDSEVHDLEAGVSRRDVWVLVDEVERLRRIVIRERRSVDGEVEGEVEMLRMRIDDLACSLGELAEDVVESCDDLRQTAIRVARLVRAEPEVAP